jgi:hypothetical protein
MQSDADRELASQVAYAILAWTGVGVAGLLALTELPRLFGLVPLPDFVIAVVGVLRAGMADVTLGLVFVGWLLGLVAIGTGAALRRLWRAPVVLPWTSLPTVGRGA